MTDTWTNPFRDTRTASMPRAFEDYLTATWLLGRHEGLARLVCSLPGVVQDTDDNGEPYDDGVPYVDLFLLADGIRAHDQNDHGTLPGAHAVASAFAPKSGGEKRSLRLLGVLGSGGVLLSIDCFTGIDQALASDWLAAVAANRGLTVR